MKDSIIRNAERLKCNYKIIQLCNFMPLPFELYALCYHPAGLTIVEVLSGVGIY